jgi:hypothetical protein
VINRSYDDVLPSLNFAYDLADDKVGNYTYDGVNLTDEEIVQFTGEKFRPRAIYDNGPAYFAGIRVRF